MAPHQPGIHRVAATAVPPTLGLSQAQIPTQGAKGDPGVAALLHTKAIGRGLTAGPAAPVRCGSLTWVEMAPHKCDKTQGLLCTHCGGLHTPLLPAERLPEVW